jgi:hypothetical protein
MEFNQVFETVDNIPGVAVAPKQNRRGECSRHKPSEQVGAVRRLKRNILEGETAYPSPVPLNPWLRMVDEESIKEIVRRGKIA